MNKLSIAAIAIIAVVVLVGLGILGGYNGLVASDEMVKNKWADVEVQYQRRMDLIPNVVSAVKGSAQFEQQTLEAVVSARSAWAQARSAGNLNEEVSAARSFDSALSRLLVTVEAYPDLKSTQAFRDLTTELEGTENRVSVARRDYNEVVREYNVMTRQFPTSLLASMFNFRERPSFEAAAGSEVAPTLDFN